LARFFIEHLDPPWELYVQPRLNTIQPDVVVIHPQLGVGVYEVKDWRPGAREFRPASDRLWAKNPDTGVWYVSDNPVDQVNHYRGALLDTYSTIEAHYGAQAPKVVTAGAIMTNYTSEEARRLLRRYVPSDDRQSGAAQYFRIVGGDAVEAGDLRALLPVAVDSRLAPAPRGSWYDELRRQLDEPEITAQMREPLELDDRKWAFVANRNATAHRRVRGAAGTGKSVLIASVAAQAALEGKQVAVLCFNITLRHYLRDLAVRFRPRGGSSFGAAEQTANAVRSNVTFLYLHEWCEQVCAQTGRAKALRELLYAGDDEGRYPIEVVRALVSEAIDEALGDPQPNLQRYDVLCIDEGQDLDLGWWEIVRRTLVPGGLAVLAADQTQALYGAESRWTDEAMTGAGFRGRWTTLEGSHRLPDSLIDPLTDFCARFLEDGEHEVRPPERVPQRELNLCTVTWLQVSEADFERCLVNAVQTVPVQHRLAPADVTFLVADHDLGLACIEEATTVPAGSEHGPPGTFNHVFGTTSKVRRRRKLAFWGGSGGMKGSTVHSFKGWESRCVIVGIKPPLDPTSVASIPGTPANERPGDEAAWRAGVYVALTRVSRSTGGSVLYVVCADEAYAGWAQRWFPDGFARLT
jgi:hypothetical protein